jgi:fructose-1,6-bisphosphatase
MLLQSIQLACKVISNATKRAGNNKQIKIRKTNKKIKQHKKNENTKSSSKLNFQTSFFIFEPLISIGITGDIFGAAGGINSTGDDQKKLDVLANDVMINAISFSVNNKKYFKYIKSINLYIYTYTIFFSF